MKADIGHDDRQGPTALPEKIRRASHGFVIFSVLCDVRGYDCVRATVRKCRQPDIKKELWVLLAYIAEILGALFAARRLHTEAVDRH